MGVAERPRRLRCRSLHDAFRTASGRKINASYVFPNRARLTVLIDGDHDEDGLCHLFTRIPIVPARPGFDLERDGGAANLFDAGIDAQCITDLDRLLEDDLVDCDRDGSAAGHIIGADEGGKVHLRHDPAAENIAGRIGIGRHGKRSERQFHIGGRLLIHLSNSFHKPPAAGLKQPHPFRQ
ncbi:hypothetical protein AGR2A_Lc80151 [Agrobacterium genomosp. 2 str. CFBP 5494]|uniref:Uncharacterized protein n=1 Tax=Agrobacterium genomosp. 2 str. CFBP 5494 TaxID=1183436 RepID=A0A9W5F2V8_9HYPH|nr:hypothetical protein AGR2A_Lc80151 [Agrobacterium genomosp. 2 str. CFBP 5494]